MANNYWKPRVWNAYCDSCGFKFKSDQLMRRWDNLMVDEACWEPRQAQDFIKAVKEYSQILPWSRPDNEGIDVSPSYATVYIDDGYYVEEPGNNINQQTYYVELV